MIREVESVLYKKIISDKNQKLASKSPMDQDENSDECIACFGNIRKKFLELYKRFLITPENKKLKYFHVVVSFTFIYDFMLTGLILSNYKLHQGKDYNF